jgi:hypothetical protein
MKERTRKASIFIAFVPRFPPLFAIGVVVSVYALAAMTLFQFVFLTTIKPSIIKNGLIRGDPQYYHMLASDLADRIVREGWSAWSLRPEGQGNAGITAALYAATTTKPWMVIPLNAF